MRTTGDDLTFGVGLVKVGVGIGWGENGSVGIGDLLMTRAENEKEGKGGNVKEHNHDLTNRIWVSWVEVG